MSLLGIHVDAQRVTAGIYDIEGRLLGGGVSEYRPDTPEPDVADVWMDVVWDALKEAVGRARSQALEAVTAMSLAVHGEAQVAIDREGRALGPSLMPQEAQADGAAHEFHERFSPIEVMRLTGMPPASRSPLVRLLWLKTARPEVYEAAWKFMDWHAHLANRLGPGPVTEASLAGRTQMFDIVNGVWAESLTDLAGIDRGKLPDVRPAATSLGEISRKAASELGLPSGVKLVVGGCDRAVAALGVGAISAGRALDATDAEETLVAALHEPVVDPGMIKNGFTCTPHVVGRMYVAVAHNPSGGRLMDWLADVLGRAGGAGGRATLDALLAEMDPKPTDLLVLPYLGASGTPYHDAAAAGGIVGLRLGTTRGALVRAAVEGLALEMRLNAALLAESGIRLNELHVTGPAADSREWCQVKADVLGLRVCRHPGVDAAALGAAMLAGIGTGVYDTAVSAVEFCVASEDDVRPNGDRTDLYAKTFARYRKLYPALRDVES